MKSNHTDITMVLDRSGSMASVADETIHGVNHFLDEQRKAPGAATFTLHQFDNVFETPIPSTDIRKAKNLTSDTFVPRNSTALLDAIGRAIGETGSRLEKASDAERAGKVVFVIVTDGHENASHEYDHAKVHEMIEHQRTKYSWEFVFLGANQDAIKAATGLGMSAANSMTYAANTIGTQAAFASVSSNVRSFRCSTKKDMSFEVDDYTKQKDAGV